MSSRFQDGDQSTITGNASILNYKTILPAHLMKNSRKGNILALIPEGLNHSNKQKNVGTNKLLEDLILKTTLCVNTQRAEVKDINHIFKDEEDHLTQYDKIRRAKAAETRKKNSDFIEEKYSKLAKQDQSQNMTKQ